MDIYEASVSLMVQALVISARWAARSRRLSLELACAGAKAGRVAQLEARILVLEGAVAFRDARLEVLGKRLGEERPRQPYPVVERLRILWLMEYYGIPKRRVKETFGVARSSVHHWLKAFQQGKEGGGTSCSARDLRPQPRRQLKPRSAGSQRRSSPGTPTTCGRWTGRE